ncbi:MAG: glutathione S-transferase [Pseudomonadales bacterium]|nr:glutathione S-transferase [Pseudomonadales bacterium]
MNHLPILYSFRRCPYAIRTRLAVKSSGIHVALREVVLANKPKEMLACSPKGTVPVLQLVDGTVIDESRDIIMWALEQSDPQSWLPNHVHDEKETLRLIDCNDYEFKLYLDKYKYADRFPEQSIEYYRQQAEVFLRQLEDKLHNNLYLLGNDISLADIAIFPFIRQFAHVDKNWFDQSEYKKLQKWLAYFLALPLFNDVMKKYPRWTDDQAVLAF